MSDDISNKIAELEREIAMLPEGSITKKNIKGKDYYYHNQDCKVCKVLLILGV